MSHRSTLRKRVSAAAFVVLLLTASTATAQDVPFAFLIDKGWKSLYAHQSFRSDNNLYSWYARGQIHVIVNGQKGADIGTAHVHAFSHSVPDPAFAGIKPLAGVITMTFQTYQAHLGLIETPSGLKTTVAFLNTSGEPDYRVSGRWVLADGSAVGGGSADDLVVGGIVHFGTPAPASTLAVTLWPYFQTSAYANELPFYVYASSGWSSWQVGSSASYANVAPGPVRSYMRSDVGGFYDDFSSAMSVLQVGGDEYVVVTCSQSFPVTRLSFAKPLKGCAVAGVGPLASRITGRVASYEELTLQQIVMTLELFFAP